MFAQDLGKLAPDFIVSVLGGVQGFGTDDKMWYALILERLDITLLDLMRMNKYLQKNLTERLDYVRRVCHIVEHMHAGGVVWLDLKPQNIMLKATGPSLFDMKAIDLDSARVVGENLRKEDSGLMPSVTPMYASNEVVASASPERLRASYFMDVRSLSASLLRKCCTLNARPCSSRMTGPGVCQWWSCSRRARGATEAIAHMTSSPRCCQLQPG